MSTHTYVYHPNGDVIKESEIDSYSESSEHFDDLLSFVPIGGGQVKVYQCDTEDPFHFHVYLYPEMKPIGNAEELIRWISEWRKKTSNKGFATDKKDESGNWLSDEKGFWVHSNEFTEEDKQSIRDYYAEQGDILIMFG